MNIENLLKVREHMSNLPESRIDMKYCWTFVDGISKFNTYGATISFFKEDCGTAGCIAGYACLLGGTFGIGDPIDRTWYGYAKEWLGLTPCQADKLFYVYNWPMELQTLYKKNKKLAVLLAIDQLIKGVSVMRTLNLDGSLWKWKIGKGGSVVIISPKGVKIVTKAWKIKGVFPETWDRGQYKKTRDGALTPKEVAGFIRGLSC